MRVLPRAVGEARVFPALVRGDARGILPELRAERLREIARLVVDNMGAT